MCMDYYAYLANKEAPDLLPHDGGLASGFVDECLVGSCLGDKDRLRQSYMDKAPQALTVELTGQLALQPGFSRLPDPSWLGLVVNFELLAPWYSKDDRPFHVLDNPVRKDRVFGVPFMSAASWKGLLRWACRMQAGLLEYLRKHDMVRKHDMELSGWTDPAWIIHLFGNERGEGEEFSRGALLFYPTWFDKIGFEVINPHDRARRAGTQPIYYEVVPAKTEGTLRLLYAPVPGQAQELDVSPGEAMSRLVSCIEALLEKYGISAKRTAGWGAAKITGCSLFLVRGSRLEQMAGVDAAKKYVPPQDIFKKLMDEKGEPIRVLLDEKGQLISTAQFRKLGDKKPECTNAQFKEFKEWYEEHGEEYKRRLNENTTGEQLRGAEGHEFETLAELKAVVEKLGNAQNGGSR